MSDYGTAQETFWAEDFGQEYIDRNVDDGLLRAKLAFFAQLLKHTGPLGSVIELGANVGLNLRALKLLAPALRLEAVEINPRAAEALRQGNVSCVHETTLLGFRPERPADLAFTMGVLIHIAPEALPQAYDALHASSARYILVAEYYSPKPVNIPYRGHQDRLFKRDFAGELLDRFPDLALVHYGFLYHRDPYFPLDDINWFLLEKRV
ncbi:MAG: pseudaminic acid biosynthesis-associated methylase [Humidesulfovibrio sp.]